MDVNLCFYCWYRGHLSVLLLPLQTFSAMPLRLSWDALQHTHWGKTSPKTSTRELCGLRVCCPALASRNSLTRHKLQPKENYRMQSKCGVNHKRVSKSRFKNHTYSPLSHRELRFAIKVRPYKSTLQLNPETVWLFRTRVGQCCSRSTSCLLGMLTLSMDHSLFFQSALQAKVIH